MLLTHNIFSTKKDVNPAINSIDTREHNLRDNALSFSFSFQIDGVKRQKKTSKTRHHITVE